MSSKKIALAAQNRCAACGACVRECPRNAIEIYRGCYASVDETVCAGCGKCAAICPANAIETVLRGEKNETEKMV